MVTLKIRVCCKRVEFTEIDWVVRYGLDGYKSCVAGELRASSMAGTLEAGGADASVGAADMDATDAQNQMLIPKPKLNLLAAVRFKGEDCIVTEGRPRFAIPEFEFEISQCNRDGFVSVMARPCVCSYKRTMYRVNRFPSADGAWVGYDDLEVVRNEADISAAIAFVRGNEKLDPTLSGWLPVRNLNTQINPHAWVMHLLHIDAFEPEDADIGLDKDALLELWRNGQVATKDCGPWPHPAWMGDSSDAASSCSEKEAADNEACIAEHDCA